MPLDASAIPAPWRPLGVCDSWGRPMYLARVPTIDAAMDLPLPELARGTPRGWFKLFLASEVPLHKDDRAYDVALRFTLAGCCSMCAWGASCSEWHDTFDYAVVIPEVDGKPALPFDPDAPGWCRLTTWHERQTLDEARWYFTANADPDDGFRPDCHLCLMLVIGGEDLAASVEESCGRGVELPDDRS